MANDEHLKLLKEEGVEAWNEWRQRYPPIRPDLQEANLWGAGLQEAYLRRTNLQGAHLQGAHLQGAYLQEADLSGADLQGANLSGADLSGADLTNVHLGHNCFVGTNLQGVIGLESCRPQAPSIIDFQALYQSWPLPLSFLRACELPDEYIAHLPGLVSEVAQPYSCFISYSIKDEAFANRLYADLQEKGVWTWYDPNDLRDDFSSSPGVFENMRVRDKVLIVLSESSIQRRWCKKEVRTAISVENDMGASVLLPVRIDNTVMQTEMEWASTLRRERNIVDFVGWDQDYAKYQQALIRVLRYLKSNPPAS